MALNLPGIDDTTVARLAEAASVDARSVIRRLAGLPVKGKAGARIDNAIARHALATLASSAAPDRAA